MSEVTLSIDTTALESLNKRLKKAANTDFADFTPANKRVLVYLDSKIQRNFIHNGALFGGWIPFKYGGRVTTKEKANKKVGKRWVDTTAKLLRDTGTLRAHFNIGDKAQTFNTNFKVGITNNMEYASTHHFGEGAPRRPLIPKVSDIEEDVIAIYDDYIKQVRKKIESGLESENDD